MDSFTLNHLADYIGFLCNTRVVRVAEIFIAQSSETPALQLPDIPLKATASLFYHFRFYYFRFR